MTNDTEKDLIVFQGIIHQIIQTPKDKNGIKQIYERAVRSPGTRIIITSNKDSEVKILLNKEFRKEHNAWDFRLPGGKVFNTLKEFNEFTDDINSIAIKACEKEAIEETGLVVHNLEFFELTKCGATIEWDLYYFTVSCEKDQNIAQVGTEHEEITHHIWVSKTEFLKLVMNKDFKEDRSAPVIIRFFNLSEERM